MSDNETLVGGIAIVAVFAIGFLLPALIEKLKRDADRWVHGMSRVLAAIGLGAHACFDGAGLSIHSDSAAGIALPLAVLMHRLPVGVVIWGNFYPSKGARVACHPHCDGIVGRNGRGMHGRFLVASGR